MKNLLIAGALAVGSSAFAAQVDLDQSTLNWQANKVIAGGHTGTLKIKSAELKQESGKLKSGKIVMDIKSADVTDLQGEWKTNFLTHIKSGDFFNVEKYPEATLILESFVGNEAQGKLTIKDKTNPVKITFNQVGNAYEGSVVFDRTKYDIIYGSNSFFKNLGDKAIAHDVKVSFKVVLK